IQDIAFGKGQTFRDFLEDRKQEYSSLLYPDMELPTYREVLEPLIDAVKTRRNDPDFELTDFNKLRADEKPLFRKFVPRLRNLGQIPKNGQPIS
ncbi:MAG: hypothetical protein GTN93_15300, partial [Anaerolineae bacterium]|nr:hypothetical protein [Anaerolineae bacterium]